MTDPASAAASQANKEEVDSRSIFVGNVRTKFVVIELVSVDLLLSSIMNDNLFTFNLRVPLSPGWMMLFGVISSFQFLSLFDDDSRSYYLVMSSVKYCSPLLHYYSLTDWGN